MASDVTPYLIDANVCLGFADDQDSLHSKALATINELIQKGSTFILLDHVIQEILTVLLYSSQGNMIDPFLMMAFNDPHILPIDTPIEWLRDAASLATDSNFKPKISMVDWLLLSRSIATDAPILTFDKQLLAASKKLC